MSLTLGPQPFVAPLGPAPEPVAQTYVLLAMGQSNMVDQSANDSAVAWPANAQVMDTRDDSYGAAANPLYWLETNPGADTADWQSGPGQLVKHFAINWCAANPTATLLIVPAARGGTGFLGDWLANGARLYTETLRLLDQAFADHPGAQFLAMLAQHGENDASDDNRVYRWNAAEMIAKLRARYGVPALPVIWGEPGPAAQFTLTTGPAYDDIRAQIRALPAMLPHVATAREADVATFDGLSDLDNLHFDQASQKLLGGLHYQALATAQGNVSVSLPDVALVWQMAGEHGFTSFDMPTHDIAPGDTLVVLAGAHRSSGTPTITGITANGTAGVSHLAQLVVQSSRIGLSVASVTPAAIPAGVMSVTLTGGINAALGGALSVWRVRGGIAPGAGAFGHDAALGALSVTLSAGLPGPVAMLGYAVDTGGAVSFTGDGTAEAEGAGNTNAAYFTARRADPTGAGATLSLTPSQAPSHVCGMVAVALG